MHRPSRRTYYDDFLVATVTHLCLATPVVTSNFNVDDEGWRISGDGTSSVPTYLTTGGNPNGFVRGFDQTVGGVWQWEAPAKFLGNRLGSYGSSLTYDLRMRGSGPLFDDSDVMLEGSGSSLYLILTPPVPQDIPWTSYSALLSELAPWHMGSYDGPLATQADVKTVLTNLTRLRIRGEFISGSDNGDLDNVTLQGLPGDYNVNGTVDAADYTLWRDHFGSGTALPNDDTPGVGNDDYTRWKNNFGQSAGSGSSAPSSAGGSSVSVPEPASWLLLITFMQLLATQRGRLSNRISALGDVEAESAAKSWSINRAATSC